MTDLDAIMAKATEDLKRAAFRQGYEAGYRKAYRSAIDLLSMQTVVDARLHGDVETAGLLTEKEIADEAAKEAEWEQTEKDYEQAQTEELAAAVAAGVAKALAALEAERPLIAPSPEPERRPLMIEGPAVENGPEPVEAANYAHDNTTDPTVEPAGGREWRTDARKEMLLRLYPVPGHVSGILDAVNALPGEPMTATQIFAWGNELGMRRPRVPRGGYTHGKPTEALAPATDQRPVRQDRPAAVRTEARARLAGVTMRRTDR